MMDTDNVPLYWLSSMEDLEISIDYDWEFLSLRERRIVRFL